MNYKNVILRYKRGDMNTNRFELFLENARLLRDEFGIVPLLYGSLGLELLTGDDFGSDDIDILIPKEFITVSWQKFRSALEDRGYLLTDEHEHTFSLDGVEYSYADIEDLEHFAGIRPKDIGGTEVKGIRFLLLSLEQYLAVYKRSSKDGYRANVRGKKDEEKIKRIKSELQIDQEKP